MSEFSAESIAVGFLITWGIGLIPPFVVRYLIVRKPLGKWPAISVCVGFWFFNFFLFTILGSTSKSHSALILVAAVSYWLLTRRGSDASVSLEQSPPEVPQTLVTPTALIPQAAAVSVTQFVDGQATTKKVQPQMIEGNADIEDMLYERIGNELASGKPDTATWTKSFAQASGDENQAKALYIVGRFEKLLKAHREEVQRQYEIEQAARHAAEAEQMAKQSSMKRLRECIDSGGVEKLENNGQSQPFLLACQRRSIDEIERLLDSNIGYLAVTNADGATGLHLAIMEGREDVAMMLIKRGAMLDAVTKNGHSPLSLAQRCFSGVSAVRALLEQAERGKKGTPDAVRQREQVLMEKYGITFNGHQFCFKDHRYDRLSDAVSYAELVTSRLS